MEEKSEKSELEKILDNLKDEYGKSIVDELKKEGEVFINKDKEKVNSIEKANYFIKISPSISNRPVPQKIPVVDEIPDNPSHGDIILKRDKKEVYIFAGNNFVPTDSI